MSSTDVIDAVSSRTRSSTAGEQESYKAILVNEKAGRISKNNFAQNCKTTQEASVIDNNGQETCGTLCIKPRDNLFLEKELYDLQSDHNKLKRRIIFYQRNNGNLKRKLDEESMRHKKTNEELEVKKAVIASLTTAVYKLRS